MKKKLKLAAVYLLTAGAMLCGSWAAARFDGAVGAACAVAAVVTVVVLLVTRRMR